MKKNYNLKTRFTLIVACLMVGMSAFAQLPMTRSIFNAAYTPIVAGTTSTATGDDAFQQNIPVGFSFNYLGTAYTQFSVSTNGWLSFVNGATFDAFSPDLYATTTNGTIAPWWDDLSSSAIVYQTTGVAGSQICTIEWTSLSYYFTSTRTINYQVKLYEGTNVIEFLYGAAPTGTMNASESASIGIKSVTGGNGQYLDAVTGSAFTGTSFTQSDRWPTYNFRFTPGAPTVLAGGTYNVGVGQTYRNLNEAAAEVNHRGISGPVVFNLVDAQYDVTAANGSNFFPVFVGPIAGASATNTTTFTKTGTAAIVTYQGSTAGNLANQASTTVLSATGEAIIGLVGADYVRLNNLDIRSAGTNIVDHGIGVYNSSAIDGATNNIVSNVSVSMSRAITTSRGIISNVVTIPTAATGANSNNIFRDFTIKNVYAGVQLNGNATFPDLNTQVTTTLCTNFNSIGDPATANDIGNLATATYGINATNLSGFTISNNSIRNVTNTGGQADGINVVTFQGTCSLNNNKIQTIRNAGAASTTGIAGIRLSHAITGTNTIRVYNNAVSEITSGYTGVATTARTLKGIMVAGTGGATTQTYEVYNNSVSMDGSASLNLSNSCFEVNTAIGPIFKLGNNVFANFTATQAGVAKHYIYTSPTALTFGPAGTISSNNDLFIANDAGVSGFTGFDGTTNYNTVANWAAAMTPAGMEAATVAVNPSFLSATSNLHATNFALNGSGIAPPAYITTDLDCAARTPDNDMGSYRLDGCAGLPTAGAITGATAVCSGLGTTLTLVGASSGAGISYQWASSTVSGGPYTTLLGTSTTQATGPVTVPTYYVVGVACSSSGLAAVTTQYSILVNPLPVMAVTPSTATICNPGGTAVLITASGAATYSWLPVLGISPSTGAIVSALPTTSTTYTVTGTSAVGCVNTATTVITVAATPTLTATATPTSVCTGGSSVLNAAVSFSTYCQPTYTNGTGFGDYISSVQLGTISNATLGAATPFYTLFPATGATTTTLVAGTTYTITLSAGTYTQNDLAAFIDYNQNVILNDAGEKLGETDNLGAAPLTTSFTFTVPLTAVNGTTRLRVREMDHGTLNDMDPCASQSTFGETEDYIITITGGVASALTYAWTPATFLSSTTIASPTASGITTTTTYTVTVTTGSGCFSTATVTVTAGSALTSTSTISPSNSVCTGTTVTLNSLPVGGGAPYTYAWTGPGGFTSALQNPLLGSATAALAGTYSVTVTDNCAITSTSTVTLTVNALPIVAVTPTTGVICFTASTSGSDISLVASGATTYTWSPALGLSATTGASVFALPATPTTYTVIGTDVNGCIGSASTVIAISSSPSLIVSATPATICSGNNSQLLATASVATSYTISNPAFALEPCQTNPGPIGDDVVQGGNAIGFTFNYYGVNYTQFGISTNGNIQIGDGSGSANNPTYSNAWTNQTIPNAAIPNNLVALGWDDWLVSAGQITWGTTGVAPNRKTIVCFNTTGRGSGSADTLNGQIVLEETTNKIYFNITKKGLQPFNTNTQGLEDQTGSVISVPVVGRNNQAWSTTNTSTVFTPIPPVLTYTWTPVTFLSSTSIFNPIATAMTATTTYSVTVTAPSGCSTTDSVMVTVNPLPAAPAAANTSICTGNTASLTATGTGTLGWYTAATGGTYLAGGGSYTTPVLTTTTTYYVQDSSALGCPGPRTAVVVTVNPLPTVTATATAAAVCTGTMVTLTGGGASTYVWDNSVVNAVAFTPSATTTYMVTGTDINGCTNTTTTTVVVNPLPTVTATSTAATVCAGTMVTLTGGGAVSYTWDNSVVNAVAFTPAATTTYMVTGTDVNGCTNTTTTTVTVNVLPTVTAITTDSVICRGDVVTLTGAGATTYVWDNSVTNALPFNPIATITYNVIGTDVNGCTNTAATTVTVNALPVVTATPSTSTICAGSLLTLTGGGATTYVWDNSVIDTVAFTATTTTTYNVIGTDLNGCSNSASVLVTVNAQPTVTAASSATGTICAGTMVTLSGSGSAIAYAWDNGVIDSVAFAAPMTTTYIVIGTDSAGCTNSDTVVVTVNPLPTVTATSTASALCAGGTVTLTGGGATSYTWDNSVVNAVAFTPTATITYNVTGTDINGCVNTDSITVTVNALPIVTATSTGSAVCLGTTVTLTGGGASTYVWDNSVVNAVGFIPTTIATTTYNVIGTDGNGCTNTAAIDVTVNPLPPVTLTAFTNICLQASPFTLTGGSPAGGVYSGTGVTGGVFSPSVSGVGSFPIAYTVTDSNSCSNSFSSNMPVIDCTGITEDVAAQDMNVYPNPTSGMFNIIMNNANYNELLISIVDLQGKEVFSSMDKNVNGVFNKQINLEELSKGVYFIKVNADSTLKVQKLIIQ
jgi:Ig-like domain CHU_C associated/Secretion system C-terminal sorting domain/GEVED domain